MADVSIKIIINNLTAICEFQQVSPQIDILGGKNDIYKPFTVYWRFGGGIYFDFFLSNDRAAGVYIMYKYFIFKLIFFGKYFVKTTAWVDILA